MFTFKKPKKNRGQQRRRVNDDDGDENSDKEDNNGENVAQKVRTCTYTSNFQRLPWLLRS